MVLSKKNMKPIATPISNRRDAASSAAGTSANMKVYIRVRPFNTKENETESRSIVKLLDERVLVFDPRENEQPFFFRGVKQRMRDITKKQNKEIEFIFDQVYSGTCSNIDVFNGSINGILPSLLDGYNCSVFVYGATGAGKTYTMLGNNSSPGIIYLTMQNLYERIEEMKETRIFDIGISYLEVYNENVHDLLNPSSGALYLREDTVNGVIVAGLKLIQISNADHLFDLLRQGNANRTQHPTDANAESSRSHAVFQVFIKMQSKESENIQIVKLSMIDLAGSERGAATNCTGLRFKEGSNINKSLLALGNCINKLADGVRHIPYRDSKLTRLLKDSLGGNCQTVMIACIGPTIFSYDDTYNTLKYATRARSIKNRIAKNILSIDFHIDHYKLLVQELQQRISTLEKECGNPQVSLPDLDEWKKRIETSFSERKIIYKELLTLYSTEKIRKWKIKYRNLTYNRIPCLEDSEDDQDFSSEPIDSTKNRLDNRLNRLFTKISEAWDRKLKNDENIKVLTTEIEENNIAQLLEFEIYKQQTEVSALETNMLITHKDRLLNLLDMVNENQRSIVLKVTDQNDYYLNLLRGYNKITNNMALDRKDIDSMLKGKLTVSWEISPTNVNKIRAETLKTYTGLPTDLLHSNVTPCPLIEDIMEGDTESKPSNECSEEDIAENTHDKTFDIPMTTVLNVQNPPKVAFSNSNTGRVVEKVPTSLRRQANFTPLRRPMKENRPLSGTVTKRKPIPIRKNITSFKVPKTPLIAKNKNV